MVGIILLLLVIVCLIGFVYRQTKIDRIRRRQIDARPFPRHEKFFIKTNTNSDSVRFGGSERGKRHEFDNGEIHGTATGNLFFLFHGTGAS